MYKFSLYIVTQVYNVLYECIDILCMHVKIYSNLSEVYSNFIFLYSGSSKVNESSLNVCTLIFTRYQY